MNGGDVERIIAVADSQEAGGLLESLGSDAGYGCQLYSRAEAAVFIAELDDFLGSSFVDAGDIAQQCPGSGVQIYSNPIDATFNHRFQRLMQAILVDIVLILSDTDGLGVELDQLGQRILQAARDGDGSSNGQVEIGELLASDFGSRVDRRAGFIHSDAEDGGEGSPS